MPLFGATGTGTDGTLASAAAAAAIVELRCTLKVDVSRNSFNQYLMIHLDRSLLCYANAALMLMLK